MPARLAARAARRSGRSTSTAASGGGSRATAPATVVRVPAGPARCGRSSAPSMSCAGRYRPSRTILAPRAGLSAAAAKTDTRAISDAHVRRRCPMPSSRSLVSAAAAAALVAGATAAVAKPPVHAGRSHAVRPAPAARSGLPQVSSGHRPGPDVLYAKPPRAPQLENTGVWHADPILVSGAQSYRDGEWLYQDYLFDDHGAMSAKDLNDPYGADAHLYSPPQGTFTYPTSKVYANNAADLVEFRVKPLARATAFRVTLDTLKDPARTAFTIALGSSDSAVGWPHGVGVSSPAQAFVTRHGTRADTAVGGEAIARLWRDSQQAKELAMGDVTPFAADVDFGKLRSRARDDSGVPKTGPIDRILASHYSFGQGVDPSKVCFEIGGVDLGAKCIGRDIGQLQPYALYIPKKKPRGGYGLTLLLHSLSANYNQYLGSHNQSEIGDRKPGSLVLTPGGRGPDGFYAG